MANYGIPYMGSKDALVHKIAPLFPKADNFYDLFGGGFAVSHFMLFHKSQNYKRFFYNELKEGVAELVRDAIAGKYSYKVFKPEWISREMFAQQKDSDAYVRCMWSFGNNQIDYLFGEENELNKRSLHNAVVFNEFDELAKKQLGIDSFPAHLNIRSRRRHCRTLTGRTGKLQQLQQLQQLEQLERLQQLEQLERLQQLERLERLQQLERLEQTNKLTISSKSYEDIQILSNSVIYCDPPYKGTVNYINSFDHEKFWDWVRNQNEPVFVSEYQAPKDIAVIMALNHKKKLCAKGSVTDSVEKIFGNDAAYKRLAVLR